VGKGLQNLVNIQRKLKKGETNFSPPTTTSLYSVIFINDKKKATAQNYAQLTHCHLSSKALDLLH